MQTLNPLHKQQLQLVEATLHNKPSVAALAQLWVEHDRQLWYLQPDLYLLLGSTFLKRGEPLLAYDVLSEGLQVLKSPAAGDPPSPTLAVRLAQQQALALAETGAIAEAAQVLNSLLQSTPDLTAETLGLLGRTYKEMAATSADNPTHAKHFWQQSLQAYQQAYQQATEAQDWEFAYYTGINAATVAYLSGHREQAGLLANAVREICLRLLAEHPERNPYWLHATLGEAELLCEHPAASLAAYRAAVQHGKEDLRALVSMRKQIQRLLTVDDGTSPERSATLKAILSLLPQPTLVVFSGHRLDAVGATKPRFPPENEPGVEQEIGVWLDQFHHVIAYCSAANGSDLIFIEQVLSRGGEVHIVLPFDRDTFLRTSVSHTDDARWEARYTAVLARATRVIELTEYNATVSPQAFDFANLCITGLAAAHRANTHYALRGLAVWDGSVNTSIGGTFSALQHWQQIRLPIDTIDPIRYHCQPLAIGVIESVSRPVQVSAPGSGVVYYTFLPMLFADVKGYSQLNERQLVTFSTLFLGVLRRVFDHHEAGIFTRRTQGDGLFVVFHRLQVAAAFAVEVNAVMSTTDWAAAGLPADLQIRISLDAGPCYAYQEPITGNTEFCGHYVNRAARLEPVTPPGHIFASETFVAMAYAAGYAGVRFVYAGQIVLPKGHGIIPAYHLLSTPPSSPLDKT